MIKKKFAIILGAVLLTMFCFVPYSMAQKKGSNTFISPTLGATFVLIPAGTFMMGSPREEPGRDVDEGPHHQVTISRPFFMQTTEVTQGQWKRVMGNNPSHFGSCGDDCPVEHVSWEDVQGFVEKLNRMERTDKYRLPTEAQWEYAARAGTTTRFHTGNSDDDLLRVGWLKSNSASKTHQVGQKTPNSWGLYDMHGNVYEWVQDWFRLYAAGSLTDPAGPPSGLKRVRRGGSWSSIARFCRSANRDYFSPDQRSGLLGFRLLRTQ
jgi:formylglycine-generating enzyme required for sulfatase activity